jgi:LmbE family N-acetylglucosaminyl deacetylase
MVKEDAPTSRRLLAVMAHPDDESFGTGGTLAHYAKQGAAVSLICATRGEAGSLPADMADFKGDIAALREHELRCASEILGLKDVFFLDYRDSGMPGAGDNQHPDALIAQPQAEVSRKIALLMREIKPQVVITFDPIGGYRHPDHIAVHEATVDAFYLAGNPDTLPGPPPAYQPQKLYYYTFSKRMVKFLLRLMPIFGINPRRFGRNNDIDLLALAEDEFPIHAKISYREVVSLKEKASACHHSQQDPAARGFLRYLDRMVGGKETFMRGYPPAEDGLRESDLFEGVDASR